MIIYIANDGILTLDELTNGSTGEYENDATVTAQLKDAAGTNVGTQLTLAYVAASNGRYRATIEEDTDVDENTAYVYHIEADAGSDLKAHWEIPVTAMKRTS
jgi:hypothetical protein